MNNLRTAFFSEEGKICGTGVSEVQNAWMPSTINANEGTREPIGIVRPICSPLLFVVVLVDLDRAISRSSGFIGRSVRVRSQIRELCEGAPLDAEFSQLMHFRAQGPDSQGKILA